MRESQPVYATSAAYCGLLYNIPQNLKLKFLHAQAMVKSILAFA